MCRSVLVLVLSLVLAVVARNVSARRAGQAPSSLEPYKLQVYDGVFLKFPREARNASQDLFSIEVDLSSGETEGRRRRVRFMQRILPLFIVPFIMQSAIIPVFLSILKFMLMKSLLVGKTAMALIILNAFRRRNTFNGRLEQRMADKHYGYHGNGMEEYGVYIN